MKDNSAEASGRNESGVRGQAGKILGAKTIVAIPPSSPSNSKDEDEESGGENGETIKKTGNTSTKVTPENKDNNVPTAPVKETNKKQPTASLKTCADYQNALGEALKKTSKKADLEKLYTKVQELCKGTFTTQTLVEHVKQQFEARKAQIFASERPTNNDLSELMIFQSNLKKLDNTYKPMKTLEQEFCDHFGNRFTVPFGKVETDPDIVDGKDCALEAQKYFHAARTFGKNNHPAYDFEDLEKYVTAKVKELLNPLNAEVMKYIQILRYLNPNSPYAFPGCNDLADLQNKMAERRVAAESVNITNGPLSMEIIKALGDDQIDVLIERCSELLKTPPADKRKRYAAYSNKYLLDLAKLSRGMDDTAQAWMNGGFHIRKSTDFQTFANKQLTLADRSKLTKAMTLAKSYHHHLFNLLKDYGLSDDADKHQVEGDLSKFLEEAFKDTNENVLYTIMEFTSADTLESVDGFVTFFEGLKKMGNNMVRSLWHSKIFRNKQAGFYRLIYSQMEGRKIPKAVEGVDMNPPMDAKEWLDRVDRNYADKLAPVLDIAQNMQEATAAKNDMLPDGEKDNNDKIDTIYRPVVVLRDMRERSYEILRQFDLFVQDLGIPVGITTALNDMKSYEIGQEGFYKFLRINQKILEYSVHGFDSEYAFQDATNYIKLIEELFKQSKVYKNVFLIISLFDDDSDGCSLQVDGSIVCENKYMENKLRELEKDATWDGHVYLNRFLTEARSLNSVDDVRNLARTFLAAEKADCDAKMKEINEWFGVFLTANFKY